MFEHGVTSLTRSGVAAILGGKSQFVKQLPSKQSVDGVKPGSIRAVGAPLTVIELRGGGGTEVKLTQDNCFPYSQPHKSINLNASYNPE